VKTSIIILCTLVLTACSTSKQLDPLALVNGAEGYKVTCQNEEPSTAECYEKAAAQCKSAGYKVVDARQMTINSDNGRTLIFGCK
jgi:hypothetical protein